MFPRPSRAERAILLFLLVALASLVAVLASVEPDRRGFGTHERLPFGIPRCSWPATVGIPCPTCGVTTAACHLVHGHVVRAFLVQPFGAALMAAGLAAGCAIVWHLARNRSLFWRMSSWRWARVVLSAVLLGLTAWGYKVLLFLDARTS